MYEPEFGSFHDCEEIFNVERRRTESASERAVVEDGVQRLARLVTYIRHSGDDKSKQILLPTIEEFLSRLSNAGRSENASRRTIKRAVPTRSAVNSFVRRTREFWTSLLRQESVLWRGFILVLSVLLFNIVIDFVLGLAGVDIRSHIQPVLRFTDTGLVAILCAEAIALLALTAFREILARILELISGRERLGKGVLSSAGVRLPCSRDPGSPH